MQSSSVRRRVGSLAHSGSTQSVHLRLTKWSFPQEAVNGPGRFTTATHSLNIFIFIFFFGELPHVHAIYANFVMIIEQTRTHNASHYLRGTMNRGSRKIAKCLCIVTSREFGIRRASLAVLKRCQAS